MMVRRMGGVRKALVERIAIKPGESSDRRGEGDLIKIIDEVRAVVARDDFCSWLKGKKEEGNNHSSLKEAAATLLLEEIENPRRAGESQAVITQNTQRLAEVIQQVMTAPILRPQFHRKKLENLDTIPFHMSKPVAQALLAIATEVQASSPVLNALQTRHIRSSESR